MQESKVDVVTYPKSLLQVYDKCDPRHLHNFFLVANNGCTTMKMREKHRTECGHPPERRKSSSNRKTEINLRRRYCTWYSSTQVESCYKNHMKRGKASMGSTTESLCLLKSTVLLESPPTTGIHWIKLQTVCAGWGQPVLLERPPNTDMHCLKLQRVCACWSQLFLQESPTNTGQHCIKLQRICACWRQQF